MKKVTRIITSSDDEKSTKPNVLRVCAYARVSTDKDEQIYSLGNQRKIYEEKIRNHPGWEYVDIYYDEGITGLSTKKRDGFNKMIADAMDGKIDLIVVKSLSRFANIKVYEDEIRYACHQIVLGLIEKYNDVKDTLLELVEKAITPKKRHASIRKCLKNFDMPCCNEVETLMWRIVITDIIVSPDRTASIHIINKDVIDYALPKWSPIKNAPKPEPKRKRRPKRG